MFWLPHKTQVPSYPSAGDLNMMHRCIELSRRAAASGEWPFAAVICEGRDVIVEATNRVLEENDMSRHAELVAVAEAVRRTSRRRLRHATIYSNVEPCMMCSWMIREAGIGRVVFAIKSPVMGGQSGLDVLGNTQLSRRMPFYFRAPPEIVSGVLSEEAEEVWRSWRPGLWKLIEMRGCLGEGHRREKSPATAA
jgi:tRNA(adenine34) deaminase